MDSKSLAKKKSERLKEWNKWIADFLSLNNLNPTSDFDTISHAGQLLNDYYWRLAVEDLKPLLDSTDEKEHNLHYYKIISASELTVMAVLPFKYKIEKKGESRKTLNAEFAFYVATSIMINWKIENNYVVDVDSLDTIFSKKELIDVIIDDKNKKKKKLYTLNFRDEHIKWLADLKISASFSILSNSQTWRMVYIATNFIKKKSSLKA